MTGLIHSMRMATGLRELELRRLILSAPNRYKVYYINKRSGGKRQIAQPSSEIKFLQRTFVELFLQNLPIHPCATAYRKGMSTKDNVLPHVNNGPILKLDFKDFFPSIRSKDWARYCRESSVIESEEDIHLSEHLLFFRLPGTRLLRLSIGAPSSPMLSNVLMYEFDSAICAAVSRDHVTYTRYADDLTFSAPRTGHLVNVKRDVSKVIRAIQYPKLDINNEKTTYVTKKYHRVVTGLTISNECRVTLGRDQKRNISASVHRALTRAVPTEDLRKLSGLLSYAFSVEPDFVALLGKKYGTDTVELIRRYGFGD